MGKKIITAIVIAFVCFLLFTTVISAEKITKHEIKTINISFSPNTVSSIVENGAILDQELDETGRGYTVISLWGSSYEMGYAQAELLGEYIVKIVKENKKHLGDKYDSVKQLMMDLIWMPTDIHDEIKGMVDCLNKTHPLEDIDMLDIMVFNTIGDWEYASCRSHTCWGRYVSSPVKTLSTRRLDYTVPYSSAYHHVLCARAPNDGSPCWVSLGWPGLVTAVTGVNEYGTMVSLHDYKSYNADASPGRMPRMIACRYMLTYINDTNVSTHLTKVYNELRNYEIMTGGFINYYAPEGYGGVITCNPYVSGPDAYDLRRPCENWHHGEAMITTNTWTDGSYTPIDEDFGADAYYNDETPKTLESHWNLLEVPGGIHLNTHILSVAYRNHNDMTIWAEGKLNIFGKRTPRLEWEWNDLFNPQKPSKPHIYGPSSGKPKVEYEYTFYAIDPNNDNLYYIIDWGDNNSETTIGPYRSGEKVTVAHTWNEKGIYTIKIKARDTTGFESQWATLKTNIPKSKKTLYLLKTRLNNHLYTLTSHPSLSLYLPIASIENDATDLKIFCINIAPTTRFI